MVSLLQSSTRLPSAIALPHIVWLAFMFNLTQCPDNSVHAEKPRLAERIITASSERLPCFLFPAPRFDMPTLVPEVDRSIALILPPTGASHSSTLAAVGRLISRCCKSALAPIIANLELVNDLTRAGKIFPCFERRSGMVGLPDQRRRSSRFPRTHIIASAHINPAARVVHLLLSENDVRDHHDGEQRKHYIFSRTLG